MIEVKVVFIIIFTGVAYLEQSYKWMRILLPCASWHVSMCHDMSQSLSSPGIQMAELLVTQFRCGSSAVTCPAWQSLGQDASLTGWCWRSRLKSDLIQIPELLLFLAGKISQLLPYPSSPIMHAHPPEWLISVTCPLNGVLSLFTGAGVDGILFKALPVQTPGKRVFDCMWQENLSLRAWLCCLRSFVCKVALEKLWGGIVPAASPEGHGYSRGLVSAWPTPWRCLDSSVACECQSSSIWFLYVRSRFEVFLSMKGLGVVPPKPCFSHFTFKKVHEKCFQIFLLVLQPLNLYPFLCTFLHQRWSLVEKDVD